MRVEEKVLSGIPIAAKLLASLALPDKCERCNWIKVKRNNRLPWQMFPGIFATLDAYGKRFVRQHFTELNVAPPWMNVIGDFIATIIAPSYKKFRMESNGMLITGSTDDVLVKRDLAYAIVDYKTSKYTDGQSNIHPLYEAQLNIYRDIHLSLFPETPITTLFLCYFDPETDRINESILDVIEPNGFKLFFKSVIVPIEIKPNLTGQLAKRANDISTISTPPESLPGCKDCSKLNMIMDLFR